MTTQEEAAQALAELAKAMEVALDDLILAAQKEPFNCGDQHCPMCG